MNTIIGGIAVIGIIWFVIFAINKITDHFTAPENDQVSIPTNTHRATGCKSSLCQHGNLWKAKEAGYDTDQYTFCKACGKYIERTDNCPSFYPFGCNSGFCVYAQQAGNGQCFCSRYNQAVARKESCPYYKDFLSTDEGKDILETLSKKP